MQLPAQVDSPACLLNLLCTKITGATRIPEIYTAEMLWVSYLLSTLHLFMREPVSYKKIHNAINSVCFEGRDWRFDQFVSTSLNLGPSSQAHLCTPPASDSCCYCCCQIGKTTHWLMTDRWTDGGRDQWMLRQTDGQI